MDLSSILKTVISLADVVIKKPNTTVQNSGVDLSSIISMASVFMGGKNNNNNAGGGLGDLLGSALGSGSLGSLGSILGGGQQQQQQTKQQSGGGMGDVLGSVLGGMMGGNQQQKSSGGGMGDVLGSVLGGMMGGGQQQQQQQSGGGIGDLIGQLTSRAGTISGMLNGDAAKNLTANEKNNLTDVLNIINATKAVAGK